MDEEEVEPEREPLRFTLPTDDVPLEMLDVMLHIKQLAEKMLYHWKTFPFVLPSSITDTQRSQEGEGISSEGVISFKDLFIAPTFDELEEVARDNKGDAKHLSDKQLLSIRKTGEFEVDSIHFPGQVHRWRLSLLLQKGTQRSHESLLDDSALAMRLLVITARNRFHSHFFSLSTSFKSLLKAAWQLLDIVIGMSSSNPGDLVQKIQEEHTRFLVAELNIQPGIKRDWQSFCDFIREKCSMLESDKHKTTDLKPPPAPYKFQTPKGQTIDLRLFNRNLMAKCTEVLKRILERESKGWHVKYKDRLIMELKGQDLSYTEITEYVNRSILEEYMRRVFEAVTHSEELEALQPGIGTLLVQQAQSALNMDKSIESVREKLFTHEEEHRTLLIKTYPVRSRIPAWMNERLQEFKEDFIHQNQWCAHEDAIEHCRRQGLSQSEYFLHRDLIYMRDREPVLKKELSKVQNPTRVFRFGTRVWMPNNWVVTRTLYGETEVIPTVITDQPISSTVVRSMEMDELFPTPQPTFSVEKHTIRKTSTRFPMWRWFNFCHRTWAWMWNAMFVLGVVIPWCSPLSLRALFSPRPFMPDLELNPVNGSLCPRESSRTQTLWSRLCALWAHVRQSRAAFESVPDTGFLGKSFTRHVNRFWNYVIKGAIGSVTLVTVSVPVCLGVSLLSLAAAALTPLWMPLVTLVSQLAAVLFYDYDHPVGGNAVMYLCEAIIYRLVIQGCLQPLAALITAVVVLPLAAMFVIIYGIVKRGLRAVWDAFMFHAVIKKRGRVPWSDGFVARRIAGPGLASNYFYQVKPEQALAAVEARMELHELHAWKDNMITLIDKPKHDYSEFIERLLKPFSAGLREHGVYSNLEKETKHLHNLLKKEVDLRKQKLNTGLTPDVQSRIKLSARELKVMIAQTAKMLEGFYPVRVLQRRFLYKPERTEEEFWEDKHLEPGDWQGLATQLLTEVFSSSFLTPLEETDICFKLEVQHLHLGRYLEMLKSAEFRDDLDVVSTVHTPKGDIDVDAPYLEVYLFSPSKERVKYADSMYYANSRQGMRRRPWKKKTLRLSEIEKLEVPIPIAHPSLVAVLIHNRENDSDTIDLEDAMCQRILRAAENMPYSDLGVDVNSVELYETDIDLSTPDRTTTNSDPEVIVSHLAEQESAFSEDGGLHGSTPVSPPESIPDDGEPGPSTAGFRSPLRSPLGSPMEESEEEADYDQVGEPRVVYHESEADTSCVVEMGDDDEYQKKGSKGTGPGSSGDGPVRQGASKDYDDDDDEEEDAEEYAEGDAISLDSSTGSYSRIGDSKHSTV